MLLCRLRLGSRNRSDNADCISVSGLEDHRGCICIYTCVDIGIEHKLEPLERVAMIQGSRLWVLLFLYVCIYRRRLGSRNRSDKSYCYIASYMLAGPAYIYIYTYQQ